MHWLPSTRTRYILLFTTLMAVVTLIDELAKAVASFGSVGFAVTLWACFGVAYGWLLIEPMIDRAMILRKMQKNYVTDRINRLGREVALEFDIPTPKFCVYQDEKFDVMVVGIGNMTTVFLSESVASFGDLELKAILAHEYGHIRLKHSMVRLSLYGSLLTLAIIGSGTPMLAIVANIFVLWTMRQMEFAADHAAVLAVGIDNFKSTLMLVGCSFGDVPRWQTYFSTHPSFRQRIERLI